MHYFSNTIDPKERRPLIEDILYPSYQALEKRVPRDKGQELPSFK
jgi:hypothetical protein